jgi:hypothetical protein
MAFVINGGEYLFSLYLVLMWILGEIRVFLKVNKMVTQHFILYPVNQQLNWKEPSQDEVRIKLGRVDGSGPRMV